ncbi:tyrosine-type recombinase/integrase [Limnoglobus roseus]|uniref:tyrosine-type recombinase/integrase n=1 Tax=Limnoglobus roseus TaxID=2598579 RepID=UPI001FECB2FF|nr:tyrosine-type recombinase/integrase [Limnoglobus roseus]
MQLELEVSPCAIRTGTTVSEVLLAFLNFATGHYRRADGSTTNELDEYKMVARHARELYGTSPAQEFGPLALKSIRQKFIAAGWCRGFINQRVGRLRRIFKWAVGEELVPPAVYQALAAVAGLQRGRSNARESKPVGPVAPDVVAATLPHLNRHVRGLIEFQQLTGCRPGEACDVRQCDIDTSGKVWLYRPRQHKNTHRGKSRVVAIGPRAQVLVSAFFTPDAGAYLFSPAAAVAERNLRRASERKTPRYPSHMARNAKKRKASPQRRPAQKYNRGSYGTAIDRACDKAFPPPGELAQRIDETRSAWMARLTADQRSQLRRWQKEHRWHPNQLRHLFATQVRKEHGLEAAQVLLGHARADVTQIYAERNEELAASVATQVG